MKKLVVLLFLFVASSVLLPVQTAYASSFPNDHLIDDSIFTDTNSMSVAQIQSFLDSQGTLLANWVDDVDMRRPSDNCIVHHATGMTAAEVIYEAAHNWGAQAYNNNGCAIENTYWSDPGYSGYTLQTVSPKVLLVLLQKEQGLISVDGTHPSGSNAYKSPACCDSIAYKLARATGYGVPDSGGINEKFLGFYNQINWAAWQLRYNYERAGGNTGWDEVDFLTYTGPMVEGSFRRCGSCSVEAFDGYYPIDGVSQYMETRATASLYYYTPHRYNPNANPVYYGNYNFHNFFNDWFGSVYELQYKTKFIGKSPDVALRQGQSGDFWFKFKNTGSSTWYDVVGKLDASAPVGAKAVKLGTSKPFGSESDFGLSWPGEKKKYASDTFAAVYEGDGTTLAPNQHIAEPGQIVLWNYELTVPLDHPTGDINVYLQPVYGNGKMNQLAAHTTLKVQKATYEAKYAGFSGHPTIRQGQDATVWIKYQNVGNVNWYDVDGLADPLASAASTPTRLSTKDFGRMSEFSASWPGTSNSFPATNFATVYRQDGTTVTANQNVVKPNQIVRFEFKVTAPVDLQPGTYREKFTPFVVSESDEINQLGSFIDIRVLRAKYELDFVQQSGYPTIAQGGSASVTIRYENTGNVTWYDRLGSQSPTAPTDIAAVIMRTTKPNDRQSDFGENWGQNNNRPTRVFSAVYEADNSTLSPDQDRVKKGQIAEFEFTFDVPNNLPAGTYKEKLAPFLAGHSGTMEELGTFIKISVTE